MMDELRRYFSGERDVAFMAIAIGLVAIVVTFVLIGRRKEPFYRGLLAPVLLVALGGTIGGSVLAVQSLQRIQDLGELYDEDPWSVGEVEKPRMAKVNANWAPLKITWCALGGVAVIVAVARRGFWRGLSLGVAGLCVGLFVLDTYAERRAERYTQALEVGPQF
jgi:hypothetical protein